MILHREKPGKVVTCSIRSIKLSVNKMLALGKKLALKYDKKPYLIATDGKTELYWVEDAALPANSCGEAPLDLLSKTELYEIKKKYKLGKKLYKKIRDVYKNSCDEFELNEDEDTLEARLLIQNIEQAVLDKLKREVHVNSKWLPYYPIENTTKQTLHTCIVGASSSGKSYWVSKIIESNFADCISYVISPTAEQDPAYLNLRNTIGRRKIRLLNSGNIKRPLSIDEFEPGCCLIVDDLDSTPLPQKKWISDVQEKFMYEGRHRKNKKGVGMTVFSIFHDSFALGTKSIKASAIESSRVVLFPNLNRSISRKYMKNRMHMSTKEIKKVFNWVKKTDRWICFYLHVPQLVLSESSCLLL